MLRHIHHQPIFPFSSNHNSFRIWAKTSDKPLTLAFQHPANNHHDQIPLCDLTRVFTLGICFSNCKPALTGRIPWCEVIDHLWTETRILKPDSAISKKSNQDKSKSSAKCGAEKVSPGKIQIQQTLSEERLSCNCHGWDPCTMLHVSVN